MKKTCWPLSRDFDLRKLIEDELLMALPLVPMHEDLPEVRCPWHPATPTLKQANAEKPNPFAALALAQGRR